MLSNIQKDLDELEEHRVFLFDALGNHGKIQKSKGLDPITFIKVCSAISKIQSIEKLYKERNKKYNNVMNHGFFKENEKFLGLTNYFNKDMSKNFELLNACTTKNGFKKDSKISSYVLTENDLNSEILSRYLDTIKRSITKYSEFMNNIETYVSKYIDFPGENLDPKNSPITFIDTDYGNIIFYSIKYNEDLYSIEGYRVIYEIQNNEYCKYAIHESPEHLHFSIEVKNKLSKAFPELFL